jgi:hypothetical protein
MRYVNASNGLVIGILETFPGPNQTAAWAVIAKRVAGVDTNLVFQPLPTTIAPLAGTTLPAIPGDSAQAIYGRVDSTGLVELTIYPLGTTLEYHWTAWDPVLATGGALASGQMGIYDRSSAGTMNVTRNYYSFVGYVPATDAAVYANQTLELSHQHARRTDAVGNVHTKVSDRSGNYLRLNPGRNRLAVMNIRDDPDVIPNPNIDAGQVDLWVTERGLNVPGV